MVDVAQYFMEFCMYEVVRQMHPLPRRHGADVRPARRDSSSGEATLDDLALLEELCDMVRETSLCGLGQAAPNPVLSTLRYFRDEYLAHIDGLRCPAGLHGERTL